MTKKKSPDENYSGAVGDILEEGLTPLKCVCKSTSFMFAAAPNGEFCKLYCPCCGTFSDSLVPLKRQKLLTNYDQEAAEMGLTDEEMSEVRRMENEDEGDTSDWGGSASILKRDKNSMN